MNIKTLPVGLIDTNCYFVHLPEKRQLYVIDPGGDAGADGRALESDRRGWAERHAYVLVRDAARPVRGRGGEFYALYGATRLVDNLRLSPIR